MAKTGAVRHTHKYYRLKDGLWHCALSDCTHYMPRNVEEQVEGKKSLCWECGEEFILDERAMESARPVCFACSGVDMDALTKLLKEKGVL